MGFPRNEVEAAFQKTRAAQDADDWNAYCDLFTDDEDIYNFDETQKVMGEWAADQKRASARG
jgi:hypothetical protein